MTLSKVKIQMDSHINESRYEIETQKLLRYFRQFYHHRLESEFNVQSQNYKISKKTHKDWSILKPFLFYTDLLVSMMFTPEYLSHHKVEYYNLSNLMAAIICQKTLLRELKANDWGALYNERINKVRHLVF